MKWTDVDRFHELRIRLLIGQTTSCPEARLPLFQKPGDYEGFERILIKLFPYFFSSFFSTTHVSSGGRFLLWSVASW